MIGKKELGGGGQREWGVGASVIGATIKIKFKKKRVREREFQAERTAFGKCVRQEMA